MAHQSLYRRYRPRRFQEVRGQEHVVTALRNAVANATEGHAYLFSGPRGTGKTSTARILAKALNCEALQAGEPCCECASCVEMEAGRSFDLFELDAASNNGVDAVRDLVERAAVGSPGRTKVYILDEVHMLSPGASNALLKTLEEPPDHVRFVLATTDPQKVLPTIRSRTQHFEFQLLSAAELEAQVRSVVADAGLEVDDRAIDWVVRAGRGSSRDTLSALDQVVAAGGVVERSEPVERLYSAIADADAGEAIVAVAEALSQGHDPRVLAAAFLDELRDSFLVSLGVDTPHLVDHDRTRHEQWAAALGTATLTRSMEAVGTALVDMRQAADPRVPLEVALVRLTTPAAGADGSTATALEALTERVARLERGVAAPGSAPAPTSPAPAPFAPAPSSARAPRPPESDEDTPVPDAVPVPSDRRATTQGPAAEDTASGGSAGPGASGPAKARAALAETRARNRSGEPVRGEPARDQPAAVAPSEPADGPSAAGPGSDPPTPSPAAGPRPSAASPAPPVPPTAAARSEPRTGPDPAPGAADSAPAPPGPASEPADSAPAPPGPASEPADSAPDPPEAVPAHTGGADGGGPAPSGSVGAAASVTVEVVRSAFDDAVLPALKGVAKALYTTGRVAGVDAGVVTFALAPNTPVDRAERSRAEVQSLLVGRLGTDVTVRLVEDAPSDHDGAPRISGGAVALDDPEEAVDLGGPAVIDVTELEDATDVAVSGVDRLREAFPGAQVLDESEV